MIKRTIIATSVIALGMLTFNGNAQVQAKSTPVTFDCTGQKEPALRKSLRAAFPDIAEFCSTGVDLDNNPKTTEALMLTPSGGVGGDYLSILQQQEGKTAWNTIDDGDVVVLQNNLSVSERTHNGYRILVAGNNDTQKPGLPIVMHEGKYTRVLPKAPTPSPAPAQ